MAIVSCILALALAGEPPPPDDGVGLLATGGMLAGIGLVLAALPFEPATCRSWPCRGPLSTDDVRGIVSPAAFALSSPFLAMGMYRLQATRIDYELAADPSRRLRRPGRFALFGGIVGMVAGGALLGTAVVLVRTPYAVAARWIGGPTIVAGSLLTGAATAHRRAYDRALAIAPIVSRTSVGVSIASRF